MATSQQMLSLWLHRRVDSPYPVALLYCKLTLGNYFYLNVHWIFPKTVKESITRWRGHFVGNKRKKTWNSVPLYIFWSFWKERNCITFKDGTLVVQRLKNSFVYNLWSWNRMYLGEETFSLVGFLEWLASN